MRRVSRSLPSDSTTPRRPRARRRERQEPRCERAPRRDAAGGRERARPHGDGGGRTATQTARAAARPADLDGNAPAEPRPADRPRCRPANPSAIVFRVILHNGQLAALKRCASSLWAGARPGPALDRARIVVRGGEYGSCTVYAAPGLTARVSLAAQTVAPTVGHRSTVTTSHQQSRSRHPPEMPRRAAENASVVRARVARVRVAARSRRPDSASRAASGQERRRRAASRRPKPCAPVDATGAWRCERRA